MAKKRVTNNPASPINWLGAKQIIKLLQVLVILSLVALVVLIFWQVSDLSVLDLGRHLQNGGLVFSQPELLFKNYYSYTYPDFSFVNHHWLAGLIYYALYSLGGFKILTLLNISLALATVFVFFKICQKRSNFFLAGLISLATLLILSERSEIRPEMFSYLFLALTFYFLDNYKSSWPRRRLLWLPMLFLVWVNTHIYFIFGLALVFLKLGEELLKKFSWSFNRRFIYLSGFTLAACLINPNFISGLLYPLNIFNNYGYQIAENQSLLFLQNLTLDHNLQYFKYLFVAFWLSWLIYFFQPRLGIISWFGQLQKKRFQQTKTFWTAAIINLRPAELILSLGLSILAWRALRYLPLFSLLMTPIMARNFARLKFKDSKNLKIKLLPLGLAALIISALLMFKYLFNDTLVNHYYLRQERGLGLSRGVLDSAQYFASHNLSGQIFNDYDLGSYLIFTLPQEKVFVDNRPEAYPSEFFSSIYIPAQTDETKWRELNERYKFKSIYFSLADSTPWAKKFLRVRLADPAWHLVYFDYYMVILQPAALAPALSEAEIKTKENYLLLSASPKQALSVAALSELRGDYLKARQIYQASLNKYPDNLRFLSALFYNYAASDSVAERLEALKYFTRARQAGLRLPGIYNAAALLNWDLGNYNSAAVIWQAIPRDAAAREYLRQFNGLKEAGALP